MMQFNNVRCLTVNSFSLTLRGEDTGLISTKSFILPKMEAYIKQLEEFVKVLKKYHASPAAEDFKLIKEGLSGSDEMVKCLLEQVELLRPSTSTDAKTFVDQYDAASEHLNVVYDKFNDWRDLAVLLEDPKYYQLMFPTDEKLIANLDSDFISGFEESALFLLRGLGFEGTKLVNPAALEHFILSPTRVHLVTRILTSLRKTGHTVVAKELAETILRYIENRQLKVDSAVIATWREW